MSRRSFLTQGAAATAAATVAAPAFVHAQPTVRWRMASSFPKSLDTLWGAADLISHRVSEITGGKFQISAHAAGDIVPAFQVLDAVQAGNIEMCQTALYYFFGKEPSWAVACAIPFGLNARQYDAWWNELGGEKVFNEFAGRTAGVTAILAGNTGAQMGGWFRREISTLEDLRGLKFRIAGVAGMVFAKLGVIPQQIPGGELYPALEKGTIDAAEWVGPYDDEKLGLAKVAKFYYYPGFWEGGPALHAVVNNKSLESLPPEYKAALRAACAEAHQYMMSRYDAQNAQAIKRLVGSGTQLRGFSRPILEACYKATQEVYAEISARSADFKKLSDHYFGVQKDLVTWFRVTENTFDDFMATMKR